MPKLKTGDTCTFEQLPSGSVFKMDSRLYFKLNERFIVTTKLDENKSTWVGDGCAEEMKDLSKKVIVVQSS